MEESRNRLQVAENCVGPCIEKNCSRCCDPVKVHRGMSDIPKDKLGKRIWRKKPGTRIPEKNVDTVRLAVYECLYIDKENKRCKQYEDRPEICRNTSCIDPDSPDTIDQQHKESITTSFIKLKK